MFHAPPPASSPTGSNCQMPVGRRRLDWFVASLRKAIASGKQARVGNLLANNFVLRGFGQKMNKDEFAEVLLKQGGVKITYEMGCQMNSYCDLKYRASFKAVHVRHTFRMHFCLHYDGTRFILSSVSAKKIEEEECIAIGFVNDFLNAIDRRASTRSLNLFAPEFQYHVEGGIQFGVDMISDFLETLRAAPRVAILAVQKFPMKTAVIEMEIKILDLTQQPIYALLHLKKSHTGKWRLIYGKNRNSQENLFH